MDRTDVSLKETGYDSGLCVIGEIINDHIWHQDLPTGSTFLDIPRESYWTLKMALRGKAARESQRWKFPSIPGAAVMNCCISWDRRDLRMLLLWLGGWLPNKFKPYGPTDRWIQGILKTVSATHHQVARRALEANVQKMDKVAWLLHLIEWNIESWVKESRRKLRKTKETFWDLTGWEASPTMLKWKGRRKTWVKKFYFFRFKFMEGLLMKLRIRLLFCRENKTEADCDRKR